MHPPILQPTHPMVVDRPIRVRKPVRRLIRECNISFALSCVEEVDCSVEPSIYTEAMVFGDRDNWMFAMQEEMQSLEKMAHGTLFTCLLGRRQYAANGFSKERKVLLLARLPDLRQG
jgi:hypothetical protein